ncbi:molybdate ABC transporter permease subunit [Caulobacter sp. KR2-114]|uniref:molybdate ABC transporter permease subunit n=1 Tax=Caulobacter sp. KR2-114 TaxID=3400912 RepID=UPI003C013780
MRLSADDLQALALSLRVAVTATAAGLPVAILTALALARGRFWGRSLLDAATHLPLVLPPVATGYGLLLLLGHQGWIGRWLEPLGVVFAFRWTGAALAAAVMAFPLMVRPIRLSIEAIEREVDEAGRTLGAGPVTRFLRLTLPLAAPGVAAGAVMGFAKALGEFGATITFVAAIPGETLTVPAAIYQATQSPGEEGHAIVLCAVSATLAVAAVLVSEIVSRRIARRRG